MSASKKDELLEKALLVFYANGFQAVGMDMLVKETGISKTSMYKHFSTKDKLIEAVLNLRDEKFRNWFVSRSEELGNTPEEKLLAMFDALGEWFEEEFFRSCMFIRAASEFPDPKHPIHKTTTKHKRLLLTYVIGLAEQAGAKNPSTVAKQLMILKEGAIVTAHMFGAHGVAENAKLAAHCILREAIPHNN